MSITLFWKIIIEQKKKMLSEKKMECCLTQKESNIDRSRNF